MAAAATAPRRRPSERSLRADPRRGGRASPRSRRPAPPGRAAIGAGLQAGVDRVAELARQVGTEPAQRAQAAADRARRRRRGGAAVRVLAAPALVQRQRQRVDVGLRAGGAALGLLGRHVGEGADDVAGRGQRGAVGEAGDAEVHQLGARLALVGDEHVLRLDVAVDDARASGRGRAPRRGRRRSRRSRGR